MKNIGKILVGIILLLPVNTFAEGSEGANGQPQNQINKKNIQGVQSKTINDLFSGAGVYSLPMSFPKGPKNINLNLSLNYNSYSTDAFTPYGYAWNMGLPVISRNAKQGIAGVYEANEFIVGGEELVLIDNASNLYKSKYTNNLNKYYFENNSWRVIDSKGNIFYYGVDVNSKLSDPENILKTYSWSLDKLVDNRGNEIIYNYFKHNNQVYIDNITYAGGLYKVQFNYIDKASSLTSYRTQFEVKTSKLLSNIVLFTDNIETKRYELSYDEKDNVFSHLLGFEEKSGDDTRSKHNFVYGIGKNTHLLEKISDNKGLEVRFEYKPSVFYTDAEGSNLNPNLPFNMKTLHKIEYLDTVSGIENVQTFIYAGGAFYFDVADLYGRKYAGFNKVTQTDSKGIKQIYYFHQGANSVDLPELGEYEDHISKKGKIYRVEKYDIDGNLLKSNITKWLTQFEPSNRWKVLKSRETKSLITGNNITSSAVEYIYDIYGNILEEINYGEVNQLNEKGDFEDIKNDKKTTKLSYAKNTSKNLYGFVSSQELYDFNNILTSKKRLLYDDLALGSVDFGDLTNIQTYYSTNDYLEEKREYDIQGLISKSTNPRGFATTYIYDSYGMYPISITDAKGYIQHLEYDYKSGKPSKTTSVNGLETHYFYDNFGRLLSEKIKLDNIYTTKSFAYDNIGIPNSIKETQYFDKEGLNKQGIFTYLNGNGNIIETKKSYKDKFITNKIKYDLRGNKVFVSYPAYENSSDYSLLDTQTEYGITNTYDSLDRVTKISNKSGDIVYVYNNLDFSITNQKGIPTNYKYDIYGNLLQVTEPGDFITKYSYNTLGQLTQVIDSKNNIRSIEYDISGRRLKIEDLHNQADTDFGSREYSYDKNGNIITYTTLGGDNIVYAYDSLDRVISEIFGGNTTLYSYDGGGYSKGLLSSYTKGDYSEAYGYDIQGNLISETKNYGSESYEYEYSYNLAGQKLSDRYPDTKVTNYTFENGIQTGINYDGVDLVKSIAYNPIGKITDIKYGNDAVTMNVFDYENGYRLTKKGLLFGGNQYGLTDYTFDSVGNITNLTEQGNIPTFQKDVNYSYDSLNRLTEASYSPSEKYNYSYDSLGNILSNSKIGNYSYTDNGKNNPHAVTSIGTINYSYDDNGNVISDNKGDYVYNPRDELTSFTNNSGALVEYNYNIDGTRVEKKNDIYIDRYLNKDYEINISGTGTGQTVDISKYIFFAGNKIATVNQGDIIYHHSDHLGGANIDLDSNGTILQNVDYLPYGEIRNEYNYGDYKNKYKFTGKERDTESNLDYFEARYYGSDNGRFRSIDRVFWEVGISKRGGVALYNPQLLNGYTYVSNNPLIHTDPSGEFLETVWDVGNVIHDVGRIAKNTVEVGAGLGYATYGYAIGNDHVIKAGLKGAKMNGGELGEATIDIGVDAAATLVPGLPAGGSKLVRGGIGLSDEVLIKIKSLEKGIKSYQKKISIHENDINSLKNGTYQIDPSKVKGNIENYKEGLIKHWTKEINTFKGNIDKNKNEIKGLKDN